MLRMTSRVLLAAMFASIAGGIPVGHSVATSARKESSRVTICHGQEVTMSGTAGEDTIVGTAERDVIFGGRGDDRIRSRGSRDVICGGEGPT
jgi:hypothetical protein